MQPSRNASAGIVGHAAAWMVLVAGFALSAVAWQLTKSEVDRKARESFEEAAAEIHDAIRVRLTGYVDAIYGLQGLLHASPGVTRDAFHRYMLSLGLPHRYPQVRSITWAPVVPSASRKDFERSVRADASIEPGGYPDFTINPPGDRAEYVPITYVEPMQINRRALGFDLNADPVRRASLERARDSGRVVATERTMLVTDAGERPGVVLRLAVYRRDIHPQTVEDRRRAFAGLLGVTLRVPDIVEDILAKTLTGDVALQIFDSPAPEQPVALKTATEGDLIFDSAPQLRRDEALRFSRTLYVGGRQWDLRFSAPKARFATSGDLLPPVTLGVGLVLSALLAGLIYSLSSANRRAVRIAEDITKDLRESEARLAEAQRSTRELIEVLPNPIFFKGTDGRYLGVNKAWETFFGISRSEFIGKSVHELYPRDREVADRLHAMDQVLWGQPGSQTYESTITTPDGAEHQAVYYKATYMDSAGKVAGLIGTIVDVTERKRAEDALRRSEEVLRVTNQQLQMVIESSPLAIHSRDREGRVMSWNPAAEKMFGWAAAEVLGRTLPTVSDETRASSDEIRERLLAGEPPFRVEARRRRRDGTPIDVVAFVGQLHDGGGNITGILTMAEDVTARKQAEKRQAMENAVTRVVAESRTLDDAIPVVLRHFCETMDWQCGAFWELDRDAGLLRCRGTWSIDNAGIRDFVAASAFASTAFEPRSEGLVRRTYVTGKAVWIADIAREKGFRRHALAAAAGLRTALAYPLLDADEVLGVMEFFHRESLQPDEMVIQTVHSIGSQMGQYVVRMHAEETLKHVATHDGLTNLLNRAMFTQRLNHALVQARRYGRRLAVLFVDLDRFKVINDTLGHEVGDDLLREMAGRMTANVRTSATVARLGGDEFVVLVEEIANPTVVRNVARTLLDALSRGVRVAGSDLNITASIGVSTYPEDGEDSQALLKNADIAMYRAKEQGRNTFQFYSAELNVHTIEQLTLESDLRRALERNELLLHYQPQVHVRTGRLTGFEALVRWRHPERGLIAPAGFIPLAEETGLIVPIGEWVLNTACTTHRAWQECGLPDVRIAVNLSARQLRNRDLIKDIVRILKQTRCAGLDLEITESMIMHNPDDVVEFLEQVKQMGVRITLDDFGTGYSSLAYLQRLPIDCLKIDRSFIAEIPRQAGSMAITRATIAMAQSLRLAVIAEGVETREQVEFLAAHGCDEMQGDYFSRPVPEEQARILLLNAQDGFGPLVKTGS